MTMVDFAPPPGLDYYETDLFIPTYHLKNGDNGWRLQAAPLSICPGYWTPTRFVRDMVGLLRHGDTWMSTSPMEMESQEIGIRLSHGHVLICGMGMGWSAVNCALLPTVTRVTVVELDPAILALHRELDIAAQLPPEARAKLHIVQGNAYEYVPDMPVDLLMPDIWLPLMNDGRVEEVRRMQANIRAREVYFWGQELEIARHAVAWGHALDEDGIAATVARFDLPLIGPAIDDYPGKLRAAARQHMRGRWLPGSTVPPEI